MTVIMDGKVLSGKIKLEVASRVGELKKQGISVGLAVVLVGDDSASAVYVRNKEKDCEQVGIKSFVYRLGKETTQEQLIDLIHKLNNDPEVDGILVQSPIPKHLSEQQVISEINPDKDVDGFHVINAGKLLVGQEGFVACTPNGVIEMIKEVGVDIKGKHAVVLGRSNIVGKPMALLLLQHDATVTICHSRTQNIEQYTKSADIIVSAIGKPKFIKADMVKHGAVVVDVGISLVDGKICGDIDFENVKEVAGYITPMPGGTGPMTRAMLLINTLQSAERK